MADENGTVTVEYRGQSTQVEVNERGNVTIQADISPTQYVRMLHNFPEGLSDAESLRMALETAIQMREGELTIGDISEAISPIEKRLGEIEEEIDEVDVRLVDREFSEGCPDQFEPEETDEE